MQIVGRFAIVNGLAPCRPARQSSKREEILVGMRLVVRGWWEESGSGAKAGRLVRFDVGATDLVQVLALDEAGCREAPSESRTVGGSRYARCQQIRGSKTMRYW